MPLDFTDITIVLDRSGSMAAIAEGTIAGINSFVDEQRSVPGDGCWTLIQFDDHFTAKGANEEFPNVVLDAVPQSRVPALNETNFIPRGNTNLIDAVALAIERTGRRLAAMPESLRPDKVVFVIMTDGHHNTNGTYTRAQLNEKIAHQRSKYNWKFVFLGANQDAFAEAAGYGMARVATSGFAYSNVGAHNAYCATSRATRAWKAEGNPVAELMLDPADPDKPDLTVNVNVNS